MLTLTRKVDESIIIKLFEDVDPDMTVGELFADCHIEMFITKIKGKEVKVSFLVPEELNIVRSELKG